MKAEYTYVVGELEDRADHLHALFRRLILKEAEK